MARRFVPGLTVLSQRVTLQVRRVPPLWEVDVRLVRTLGISLALLGHALCHAQAPLPVDKLNTLKQGTVLVRIAGLSPQFRVSGTGFVADARGNTVFAVTNAHVLAVARENAGLQVEVVVDPGQPQPRVAAGRIVAYDEDTDLALVAFILPGAPRPLPLAQTAEVPETTPVYILGFPFGEALAEPNATPAVTVSRASVSALRRGTDGLVERLQLDGELNPGNSGGPIINANGEVLGAAVAKVGGTNISFVIPVTFIRALVNGSVKSIHLSELAGGADTRNFDVNVELRDPLQKIIAVTILTSTKAKQAGADPGKPGAFKPLVGAAEFPLIVTRGAAQGRMRIPQSDAKAADVFQVKLEREDGDPTYTAPDDLTPAEQTVDETPEAAEEPGPAPPPLENEKSVKLPAEMEQVEVAGGGQYLVLKLRGLPALSVFDTFAGEFAKHIRLPSQEFMYAAGGSTAVVYLPEESLFQVYDLRTYERKKTKPNPLGPVITNMLMGYSRSGRVLVRHAPGSGVRGDQGSGLALLDTTRLEPLRIGRDGRGIQTVMPNRLSDEGMQYRANRDLSMITEWSGSHGPRGICVLLRQGTSYEPRYRTDYAGYLAAGDDGRIYTGTGKIFSSQLDEIGQLAGMHLFPGLGGALYLGLADDGKLTVYEAGKTRPLGPLGEFPGWKKDKERDPRLDQRLVFMPTLDRVVFFPADDLHIVMRPFDLKAALDSAGVDYLVVLSTPPRTAVASKPWKYQIEAISKAGGVTYALELGPAGMEVSSAGLVTWTPKEATRGDGETVVLLVKDKSGEETYHKFAIPVAER